MKHKNPGFFSAVCFLFILTSVFADIQFHVSPKGDDARDGRTLKTAFASLDRENRWSLITSVGTKSTIRFALKGTLE